MVINLPKSNDVFNSMKPFYYFGNLLGVWTFKMVKIHPNIVTSKVMFWSTFRHIVQFIFVVICAFEAFKPFDQLCKFHQQFLLWYTCLQAQFWIIVIIAIIITSLAFSEKVASILNLVNALDKEMETIGVHIQHWKIWRVSFATIIFIVLLVLGEYVVDCLFKIEVLENFSVVDGILLLLAYLTDVFNYSILLLYANFSYIIKTRYDAINIYLESVFCRKFSCRYDVWVSEDLRSDIKKQRKLPKSTSDSLFIVDTVASYHIKLADIAAILNQAFCVQLLLLITTSFLGIVTALFLIAINFKQPSTDDASSYNFVFTAWAFSNTIALLVVVHTTCALCDEIEMYSLQMYHNRLQFHVCGLFPLDYTLLYTIVAGVTTHLVILIQFNSFDYGKKPGNESIMLNSTLTG